MRIFHPDTLLRGDSGPLSSFQWKFTLSTSCLEGLATLNAYIRLPIIYYVQVGIVYDVQSLSFDAS
jgi:hypothetical protein